MKNSVPAQAGTQGEKIKRSSLLLRDDSYFYGQANKGCWWMPWHQQAKKDALPAKSLGELVKKH